jgi:hypothetical protein
MHLTLSEGALAALKAMNQSGEAPDSPIEGNVTGLLNFNSADPLTQVNALNLKLSTDAGWLNNLLKIEDLPADPIDGGPIPKDDEWGASSTTTSTSKPSEQGSTSVSSDGWGDSTTSSNNDWGTSGDTGSSSTKNDDW